MNKFTAEWYATADENQLLALTHTYDEGLSTYLIRNKERAAKEIANPPNPPGSVYVVRDGIVRLTSRPVLSYLQMFGYSELR